MPTALLVALLPLVIAFVVASFRSPIGVALPSYAALLPFGQAIPTGLPGAFGSLSSLLGIVLGLALVTQLATTRRTTLLPHESVPVWLAYLALAGTSLFWSIAPQVTAFRFSVLTSLVLLFALVTLVRVEQHELIRVEDALLLGGVASGCYGLLQLLALGGLPTDGNSTGRFGNELLGPNNQAAALLLPLAIAVGRIVLRPRGGLLLNLSSIVVILVSILMTGSRGGLLALAVTLTVLVMATPRKRARAMVAMGAVSLALITLILALNPAGIGERQIRAGDDSSGRDVIWSIGLHACQTYCPGGSGYGTFPQVYAQERISVPEGGVLRRGTTYEAHNVWMLVGVETGVLGLILVAGALGLTVRSARRLPATFRGPPLAALSGIIFAGFFLSFLEYKFVWMALTYVVLCQNVSIGRTSSSVSQRAGSP